MSHAENNNIVLTFSPPPGFSPQRVMPNTKRCRIVLLPLPWKRSEKSRTLTVYGATVGDIEAMIRATVEDLFPGGDTSDPHIEGTTSDERDTTDPDERAD